MSKPTDVPRSVLTPGSQRKYINALKPHYVYQFWADDTCLYVGCTVQPAGRIGSHASSQPWWHQVTHFSAEVYPCREDGFRAETRLIQELDPAWNWYHTEKALGSRS